MTIKAPELPEAPLPLLCLDQLPLTHKARNAGPRNSGNICTLSVPYLSLLHFYHFWDNFWDNSLSPWVTLIHTSLPSLSKQGNIMKHCNPEIWQQKYSPSALHALAYHA